MNGFWTTEKVEAVVDRQYILSKLGATHSDKLHIRRFDGDCLTDDLTYIDYILSKCKRLLLVLVDIGCANHIFDFINGNYGDDDLPLSDVEIWDLNLSRGKNSILDSRFYRVQFTYIVKEFGPGKHVDYGPEDVIPIKSLGKAKGILSSSDVDKVVVYKNIYIRRRMNLAGEFGVKRHQFIDHFKALQLLQHPHLTSVWATYTQQDNAYVLLSHASDVTLKSFLEDPPKRFKGLSKLERRAILLRWIHCLVDAVAYLHEHGYAHQAIQPSNILIDDHNNIFLGEYAAIDALEYDKEVFKTDIYEHAPPEKWKRKPIKHEMRPLRSIHVGGSRTNRRVRAESSAPSVRNTVCYDTTASKQYSDASTISISRATRFAIDSGSSFTTPSSPMTARFPATQVSSTAYHSSSLSETYSTVASVKGTVVSPLMKNEILDPYPSDVFSLSTVHLQLITAIFYLGSSSLFRTDYSTSSLRSHLGQKNRTAGRGGAPPDSSFHANLGQVSLWLDKLDVEANKRGEGVFYAVLSLIGIIRQGLSKDWLARWKTQEGETDIRNILLKWSDSGIGSCCTSRSDAGATETTEDVGVEESNVTLEDATTQDEPQTSEETVKNFMFFKGNESRYHGRL